MQIIEIEETCEVYIETIKQNNAIITNHIDRLNNDITAASHVTTKLKSRTLWPIMAAVFSFGAFAISLSILVYLLSTQWN